MTFTDAALSEAAGLRARFVGGTGYGLAYGSHARERHTAGSDLDLLFVGAPLAPSALRALVDAVVTVHDKHGLRRDDEVSHEVKLHATSTEVDSALALRGFEVDAAGRLRIPPVIVESAFLNSTAFKFRLILNALTTPHVFLGGDLVRYERDRAAADRAIALVALCLLDSRDRFTVSDAVEVLVANGDGAAGEDFLGYTPGPVLHGTVQRGLACLIVEHAVHSIDGLRFSQDGDRRRRLVAALSIADLMSRVPGTIGSGVRGGKVNEHEVCRR